MAWINAFAPERPEEKMITHMSQEHVIMFRGFSCFTRMKGCRRVCRNPRHAAVYERSFVDEIDKIWIQFPSHKTGDRRRALSFTTCGNYVHLLKFITYIQIQWTFQIFATLYFYF